MKPPITIYGSLIAASALALPFLACADDPIEVPLWPDNPPGEFGEPGPDESKQKDVDPPVLLITKVTRPTLTLYPAPEETANGTAVLIAPGGGYHVLAWDLEGTEVAEWLNSLGITAAVLKYRVPKRNPDEPHLAPLQDAQRAIRLMRENAVKWRINPSRIGMLGFSAGGHLTVMTGLSWNEDTYPKIDDADNLSTKPDFLVPIYPGGLLDKKSPQIPRLKEDLAVDEFTPPTFLAHAYDDRVPAAQSVLLFLELKKFKVPAELHIYDRGGHGYGLREVPEFPVTTWPKRLADWLRVNGYLEKS